jgi:uncharacterized membrane protein YdjX (TVP38/TMEM64 family)
MSSEAPNNPPDPNRETRRLLYLALVIAGLVAVLQFTPLKAWMDDVRVWKQYVDQFGWRAHLAFVVASVAAIAVGVPRLLLAVVAGTLFGFVEGFAVAMMSGLCGSYMTFLAARRGSSEKLRQRLRANESLSRLLARPTVLKIFFVRQLPVPALAPNVMLGLVKAPHRTFLAGTFLGYLPTNAVVVAMGSAMGKEDAKTAMWMVTWGMAGLAVVALLVVWVRRRVAAAA